MKSNDTNNENKDIIIRKLNDNIRFLNNKLAVLSQKEKEIRKTIAQNKDIQEKVKKMFNLIKNDLTKLRSQKAMFFGKRDELDKLSIKINTYEEISKSIAKIMLSNS